MRAIAAFERAYAPEIRSALRRLRDQPLLPDDFRQLLRHRLFVGDGEGVVVIPAADAPRVLQQSIEREAKEQSIMDRIRAGARTLDVYNFAR